ncbi:TPA: hypothetical protein ACGO4B_001926, partial [Streptococcus suis]
MLHDVVQRKKFYTLVLQKCLTRSNLFDLHNSMWYNGLAYNIDAWIAGGCKMMMAVKLAF